MNNYETSRKLAERYMGDALGLHRPFGKEAPKEITLTLEGVRIHISLIADESISLEGLLWKFKIYTVEDNIPGHCFIHDGFVLFSFDDDRKTIFMNAYLPVEEVIVPANPNVQKPIPVSTPIVEQKPAPVVNKPLSKNALMAAMFKDKSPTSSDVQISALVASVNVQVALGCLPDDGKRAQFRINKDGTSGRANAQVTLIPIPEQQAGRPWVFMVDMHMGWFKIKTGTVYCENGMLHFDIDSLGKFTTPQVKEVETTLYPGS